MIKRKKKISELKAELAAKILECKGKRKRIAQLAMAAKIDLEETIEKVEPGWVDQPKGMLQVAFERGMIDPSKFDPRDGKRQKFYSTDGKNNEFDNLIEASSLRRVMEQMPDFVSEETLLQFHAKKLESQLTTYLRVILRLREKVLNITGALQSWYTDGIHWKTRGRRKILGS